MKGSRERSDRSLAIGTINIIDKSWLVSLPTGEEQRRELGDVVKCGDQIQHARVRDKIRCCGGY